MTQQDPHADQPVTTAGTPVEEADAAVLLLHGRGATAQGMLQFADDLPTVGIAYLALQAVDRTWYPDRFVAPIERNEPHLSSALRAVERTLGDIAEAGVPPERTMLLGFSQGACLASEYVARNARRYGGLAVLSGGLVGPAGTPREYDGEGESPHVSGPRERGDSPSDLEGTPVFLGCGDRDPHIPIERVHETRDVLSDLGAAVTEQVYEGMGHGIVADEVEHVHDLVADLPDGADD